MKLRFIGVMLVVFAAVQAAAWWLALPAPMAILGGVLFSVLAAWDDAFYALGAWKDDDWWDDRED